MKHPNSLAVSLLIVICVICLSAPKPQVAQAQTQAAYCISDIDPSQWPQVTLHVRAVDGNGGFAQLGEVKIFEGPQEAVVISSAHIDGPLNLLVLIDGGRDPRRVQATMLRALASLSASGAFKDGVDSVSVRQMYNATAPRTGSPLTTLVKGWTSSVAEIALFAGTANLPVSGGPTRSLEGLQDAIKDLKERVGTRAGATVQQAAVILFITNRIEAHTGDAERDARDWAALLAKEHIPVYAMQTDAVAKNQAPVRALTAGGGTRFLALTRGFETLLPAFYGDIAEHGKAYSVTYTSKFNGSGSRTVTLDAPDARGACIDSDAYSFTPGQPIVELDLSVPVLNFSTATQQIKIKGTLDWRQSPSRKLQSASLIVKEGAGAGIRIEGVVLVDGSVQFPVGENNFAGIDKAVLLAEIVDSTNNTYQSPEYSVTIIHTAEIVPTLAPPEPPRSEPQPIGLIVGLVAALVALSTGIGVFFVMQRNRRRFSGSYRSTATGAVAPVMASLLVVDGPHGRRGEKIRLNKARYVIGRQNADIAFYADAPQSSLSRTHCTLTRDVDMGYWIMDNGSANGTSVNGDRKPASERFPLKNGDQILLGDLNRNGVLLEFRLDNPTQALRVSGAEAGQTDLR